MPTSFVPFRASAAVVMTALCGAASADVSMVDLTSDARFHSSLYDTAAIAAHQPVGSLAAWDAMGRHAATATGRTPASSIFVQDRTEAWTDFQQAGANGRLRSFSQVAGYYFSNDGGNYARNEVVIRNRVVISNNGAGTAQFQLTQFSHGTLLSGGLSNIATASASENMTWTLTDPAGVVQASEQWAGSASVYDAQSAPVVTVTDRWQGATDSITRTLADYPVEFHGIELHSLIASAPIGVAAGATWTFDVEFHGVYDVSTPVGPTAFLSFGQTDFSGTGDFILSATDPLTGLPAPDVTFTLVDVPAPGCAGLFAVVMAGRLRRSSRARA